MASLFQLLFPTLCAASVFVWITEPLPIGCFDGWASLSIHCQNYYPDARALMCTPDWDMPSFFSDTQDVFTRDSQGFNILVAQGGEVLLSLFGTGGLQNSITDWTGSSPDQGIVIATGCEGDGSRSPLTCIVGDSINQSATTTGGIPGAFTSPEWISGQFASCNPQTDVRIYCVAGDYQIPPTPQPPTPPTVAPTDFPTTPPPSTFPTPLPTPAPTLPLPTPAPSLAPTLAPTLAPSTAAPTPLPTPPLAPTTSVPTFPDATASPATSPTLAPPTLSPSTSVSSSAPTNLPTSVPSAATTNTPTTTRPSLAPTKAPTCASCTTTVTPGSDVSSNATVVVGPPGGGVIVTIPFAAVPNCSNCSVLIIVTPAGFSGGTGIISIDVFDEDGLMRDNVELNIPITFLMPYSADLAQCGGPVSTDCVWWNGTGWLTSGCVSEARDTGTLCTCSHLTDFAVLLDATTVLSCGTPEGFTELYYAFAAVYAVLFVYCVIASIYLLRSAKQSRNAMLWQHLLILCVAVLRILSCLNYAKVFGDTLGLSAFVAAAPYPLEYLLFTKFASTWAGVVHFSMLGTEARWKKIGPVFYAINVIGTGLAVGLFVMFYLESSFEAALAGTIVLSALYLALAIAFNAYAMVLVHQLGKVKTSSSTGARREACCGVSGKIRWVGQSATVCFVVQAACSVLALLTPSDELLIWTGIFLLFNVLALTCILAVYLPAIMKTNKTVPRDTTSSVGSGGRLVEMK